MVDYATTRGVDLAESYAYSDSVTDVPMLSVVGHPVAVNPDKDLAREAIDANGRSASSHVRCGYATGCRSRPRDPRSRSAP